MPKFPPNTNFKMESPLKKSSPNKFGGKTKRMKLAREWEKEDLEEARVRKYEDSLLRG